MNGLYLKMNGLYLKRYIRFATSTLRIVFLLHVFVQNNNLCSFSPKTSEQPGGPNVHIMVSALNLLNKLNTSCMQHSYINLRREVRLYLTCKYKYFD